MCTRSSRLWNRSRDSAKENSIRIFFQIFYLKICKCFNKNYEYVRNMETHTNGFTISKYVWLAKGNLLVASVRNGMELWRHFLFKQNVWLDFRYLTFVCDSELFSELRKLFITSEAISSESVWFLIQ